MTNANGEVTFTTIYPGWYQEQATHIHVEVTQSGVSKKVTQIASPEATNSEVVRTRRHFASPAPPNSRPAAPRIHGNDVYGAPRVFELQSERLRQHRENGRQNAAIVRIGLNET